MCDLCLITFIRSVQIEMRYCIEHSATANMKQIVTNVFCFFQEEYLDDESFNSDDSLTAEKWRELGSIDAVERSRRQPQPRTRNQMAGKSK